VYNITSFRHLYDINVRMLKNMSTAALCALKVHISVDGDRCILVRHFGLWSYMLLLTLTDTLKKL
jgi:hypothetical protein